MARSFKISIKFGFLTIVVFSPLSLGVESQPCTALTNNNNVTSSNYNHNTKRRCLGNKWRHDTARRALNEPTKTTSLPSASPTMAPIPEISKTCGKVLGDAADIKSTTDDLKAAFYLACDTCGLEFNGTSVYKGHWDYPLSSRNNCTSPNIDCQSLVCIVKYGSIGYQYSYNSPDKPMHWEGNNDPRLQCLKEFPMLCPTSAPTSTPTTYSMLLPSSTPSATTTESSNKPSSVPSTTETSENPTKQAVPSFAPTTASNRMLTSSPTSASRSPSLPSTQYLTYHPSGSSTSTPTLQLTIVEDAPTGIPTTSSTDPIPSSRPSSLPSFQPSPSFSATLQPSDTFKPTTSLPTTTPNDPTTLPTATLTSFPTMHPTATPSTIPTQYLTKLPSTHPSLSSSLSPSKQVASPSVLPSLAPTVQNITTSSFLLRKKEGDTSAGFLHKASFIGMIITTVLPLVAML